MTKTSELFHIHTNAHTESKHLSRNMKKENTPQKEEFEKNNPHMQNYYPEVKQTESQGDIQLHVFILILTAWCKCVFIFPPVKFH